MLNNVIISLIISSIFVKTYSNLIVSNNNKFDITYWRLNEYFCKRVYRDKIFFNKNIENLEFLWDKIVYFSKNRDEYLKKILNTRKKRVYEFKEFDNDVVINGFAFIDDN